MIVKEEGRPLKITILRNKILDNEVATIRYEEKNPVPSGSVGAVRAWTIKPD